ncbi:MAG TPA: YrdB family protein [Jatrophihabitantaceae bacterium]|jgi:hypothetical protein|nr:YrdB family protein [Jatrophihabitantaceae bacterium]
MTDGPDPQGPAAEAVPFAAGVLDLVAFCCELAMLVVLGIAGWALGSGGLMSIALTMFYPALAVLIWSVWMAPRSNRRLRDPHRLISQVALFVATAALSADAGHPLLGIVFAVVAVGSFVVTRFTGVAAG